MYPLNTPIEKLTRVGKATARYLKALGIFTVFDLIYNFPFRYEDFSHLAKIKDLKLGQIVTVRGKIILIKNRRSYRRRMYITEALIGDETGDIKVVWFNQPFLTKNLKSGDGIFISGRVDADNLLSPQFVSPSYEKINGAKSLNTAKIVPIYSLSGNLTLKQLRFLENLALGSIKLVKEWLPKNILQKNKLLSLTSALEEIHFPKNFKSLEKARYRLKFDELFLIALQSQIIRRYLAKNQAPGIEFKEKDIKNFVSSLSFQLTNDQKKAAWQILLDMQKETPMNRLLEGDVGSGKTIVVALAVLNTVLNGYQAVFMAPTEILAKQHFQTFKKLLTPRNVKIALLSGSEKSLGDSFDVPGNKLMKVIKNGRADLVIGTHALIQEKVEFNNLGLAIIDEQHRFGVEQRKKLKDKSEKLTPHFLSLTATPIPRSLALIFYGDLDLSIIREMPAGRKKIITKLVSEANRSKAYHFIRAEIKSGRQVFVICPLIDPSDKLGVKSVTDEFKKLSKQIFPDLKIGLLHGKLKAEEKDGVMREFKENKIQILVSTSVIEVGIDIPNATIMMIEGADRFGLAQLHQSRGRVGRGEHQSYCFLFTDNDSEKTAERLSALLKSNDGFRLAEYDLKFRGPGEVYGLRQSGLPDFKIASLGDIDLINLTKYEAGNFLDRYDINDFPELKVKLDEIKIIDHPE
ncbi:MAG: ATP-dependent DNA helicase RecG [Patescibacteria group bacterium]|nr:ATP-dependent DNA helicase RecG [Patescibacteria group bacterium]